MNIRDLFRLDGKVALVTGAGSGIGEAMAEALAEAGAAVAVVDINEQAAQEVAQRLRKSGYRTIALRADVSQEKEVRQAVDEAVGQLGRLDIAVANAGIGGQGGLLSEIPTSAWQQVIDVNLTGVFFTMREAARVMIPQGKGKIISTASIYGLVGDFGFGAYAYTAAKGGVVNMTRTAAVQLAKYGIQVNAIAPAFIRTNIGGGILKQPTPATQPLIEEIIRRTPLGKIGDPQDLKGATVFLASAASDYVTGITLPVDGGWLAW